MTEKNNVYYRHATRAARRPGDRDALVFNLRPDCVHLTEKEVQEVFKAAIKIISSAARKCRRPQITPTRNLHCRSHSGPRALPICHRHCCGLPRRMAVYAKAASAAVLRHVPAVRTIAAHHDAAAGFANCNLDDKRACRPRQRFRFLCRCCACIVHCAQPMPDVRHEFVHRANPAGCISLHAHIAL